MAGASLRSFFPFPQRNCNARLCTGLPTAPDINSSRRDTTNLRKHLDTTHPGLSPFLYPSTNLPGLTQSTLGHQLTIKMSSTGIMDALFPSAEPANNHLTVSRPPRAALGGPLPHVLGRVRRPGGGCPAPCLPAPPAPRLDAPHRPQRRRRAAHHGRDPRRDHHPVLRRRLLHEARPDAGGRRL